MGKLLAWLGTLKAETVFTIVAGCWVVFGYFSYDREAKSLQLDQQRLAYSQAFAVQKLQRQDIALKTLENQKTAHEVEYQGQFRFSQNVELSGRRVGGDHKNGVYEMEHHFQFDNTSEARFELSLYVVDYFVGVPKKGAPAAGPSVSPAGEPANRWTPGSAQPGFVEWTHVGQTGAIFPSAKGNIPQPYSKFADEGHLVPGGPAVGPIDPTQSLGYGDTYVVHAPRHAYIAFIVNFCTNRCATVDDRHWRADVLSLDDIEPQEVPKKATTKTTGKMNAPGAR